jgi:tricarballylate dehydrogenase
MDTPKYDVIVVGAGNAALCAALSACEQGARAVVLECAPDSEAHGNTRFAGGVMRFAFDGVDDLRKVADLTDEEVANADFGTYTRDQYFDDLFRLTQYRTDPTLVEMLVSRSLETMIWLRSQGARFVPIYGRQTGRVGGR